MLALRLVYTFLKYNKLVSFVILLSVALIITLIVGTATGSFMAKKEDDKHLTTDQYIYADYKKKIIALGKEPLTWDEFWLKYQRRYNPDAPEDPGKPISANENPINYQVHCLHQSNPYTNGIYFTNDQDDSKTCAIRANGSYNCIATDYKTCLAYKNDTTLSNGLRTKIICSKDDKTKNEELNCNYVDKHINKDYPIPEWECVDVNGSYYVASYADGITVLDKRTGNVDLPDLKTCRRYINNTLGVDIRSTNGEKLVYPMDPKNHIKCDGSVYPVPCLTAQKIFESR